MDSRVVEFNEALLKAYYQNFITYEEYQKALTDFENEIAALESEGE